MIRIIRPLRKVISYILFSLCGILILSCAVQKKESTPQSANKAAYLMVYFKDETHGIHFALSRDGYRFTDVNNGNPIVSGDTIAEQKGIRDPHLYRGPDGYFYMAMTDLHIFANKQGLRNTEWERDGEKFGWGNNRGFVLMKSRDLLHWSHQVLRVDQSFKGLDSIGCAWAPELIWDEQKNKMMIHFTMRFNNGKNRLFYAYLNKKFNQLASYPKLLFEYPASISYIDGDIVKLGDQYRLLYVAHAGGAPGIKQALSTSLTNGYTYQPQWLDPEKGACEAPTVFQRLSDKKYVVMYDVYSAKPNNMGFSETSDFVNFTDLGHFNKGVMKTTNFNAPKHGAVIHLTAAEAHNLARFWKLNTNF